MLTSMIVSNVSVCLATREISKESVSSQILGEDALKTSEKLQTEPADAMLDITEPIKEYA